MNNFDKSDFPFQGLDTIKLVNLKAGWQLIFYSLAILLVAVFLIDSLVNYTAVVESFMEGYNDARK